MKPGWAVTGKVVLGEAGQTSSAEGISALPARPSAGIEAQRIGFLAGLVGTWLRPRRTGPHLAAGSWADAVAAHLLGLGYATGLLVRLLPEEQRESLRSLEGISLITAILLSMEATVLGAALSLMPWAAAGESMRILFGRCLKWAWWTSSILVPAVTLLACTAAVETWYLGDTFWNLLFSRDGPFAVPCFTTATYVCCWWLMWVLLRGLVDYAGPAEGPGWEPIEPLCEGCGYRLAFLHKEGICPECARPVAESLPADAGGLPICESRRGFMHRGFVSTSAGMLGAKPLRLNAPRSEMARARRFVVLTILLMLIPLHVSLPTLLAIFDDDFRGPIVMLAGCLVGAVFGSMLLEGVGGALVIGLFWGWWEDRERDLRVAASTTLYGSALLWPFVILSQVVFVGLIVLDNLYPRFGPGARAKILGMYPDELFGAMAGGLAVLLVVWWFLRLWDHLMCVRYTNS